MTNDKIAEALRECLLSPNCSDSNGEPANIVDGLFAIAYAIKQLAKHLGKEDASGPQGCLEFLAGEIKDGCGRVAAALETVATAVYVQSQTASK